MLLDPICTYIMEYISCPLYRCRSAAAISSNPALIAFACQCCLHQCWILLLAPVCTVLQQYAVLQQCAVFLAPVLDPMHWTLCTVLHSVPAVCSVYSIAGVCTWTLQWCLSALLAAVSTLAHCWILCTLLIVSVGACTGAMSCRISIYYVYTYILSYKFLYIII